jgi:hypothetical protein
MAPDVKRGMKLRTARSLLMATGLTAFVGLAAVGLAACGSGSDDSSSASPAGGSATRNASSTAKSTAKYTLPDGPVQALTVEVSQPVADLGQVSLNTPVKGGWTLRNTGTTPVSVGRPGIEVLEGC